jgi:hypothetical protein
MYSKTIEKYFSKYETTNLTKLTDLMTFTVLTIFQNLE